MSETVAGWTIAFSWNKIIVKSVGTEITLTARGNGELFVFDEMNNNAATTNKRTLRFTGKTYMLLVSKQEEDEVEYCSLSLHQVSDKKVIVHLADVPVEVFMFFEKKATGGNAMINLSPTAPTMGISSLLENNISMPTESLLPPENNLPKINVENNTPISLSEPNQNNELENVSPNEMRSLRSLNSDRNNDRFRGGRHTRRHKNRSKRTRNRKR